MDDAVMEALKLDLRIIIDIKAYDARVVPYLVSLFDKNPQLYDRALVASFFPQVFASLSLIIRIIIIIMSDKASFLTEIRPTDFPGDLRSSVGATKNGLCSDLATCLRFVQRH